VCKSVTQAEGKERKISLTILTGKRQYGMGPWKGGLGRGSGEAQSVSDTKI